MDRGLIVYMTFQFLNVFLKDLYRGIIAHRNHFPVSSQRKDNQFDLVSVADNENNLTP